MTIITKNPFITSGYISGEYFCDRENETAELTGALRNGRNMVVVSPRRMGKTGLIEHCFHQREIGQEYYTFFVDIYATGTLRELVYLLGKQIFTTLKPRGKRFVDKFFSVIGSLRPAFKLDAVSGEPVFDIGIGDIREPTVSLEELFAYLETADKPCIVAIDEFQQIATYPERNVEALLRTHIQKCRNTYFVFSGSQRHMMQNIFFTASRPFYQSASFLSLDPIGFEPYCRFVRHHFDKAHKRIGVECIRRIYDLLEGHTWYMQTIFNRLYEHVDGGEEATLATADQVLHATVEANRTVYQSMLAMLPERQRELLFAIAKERKATEITSAQFVRRHGLPSASSVQAAAKQLLDKEFVTREENTYRVYDRFFGLWLAKVYGTGFCL